jgi:hypothetical protein
MKYMAIKAYRTGKDLDNEVYKLSSERAVLGQVTTDMQIRHAQPPDKSHDSSAVYLGQGWLTSSEKDNLPYQGYYSLKLRAAFHDFEQPDFGTVHMSQTEMAVFDFRYFLETRKFILNRFSLLDLINTNPVSQLDKNISWKLRASLLDHWAQDFEGGAGMSFDVNLGEATRLSYFLTARGWKTDEITHNAMGPEMLALFRPTEKIGFSTSLTYFGVISDQPFFRVKAKLNWNVANNIDVQAEAENLINHQTDFQLRLLKNFIF